jgi:hypothetical protein
MGAKVIGRCDQIWETLNCNLWAMSIVQIYCKGDYVANTVAMKQGNLVFFTEILAHFKYQSKAIIAF